MQVYQLDSWYIFRREVLMLMHQSGCEDLGWPSRRRLLMICAIDRNTMVWLGPNDDNELMAEFMSFVGRRVVRDADVWAGIDSPENVLKARVELATLAGLHVRDPTEFLGMPISALWKTQKARQRVQSYVQQYKNHAGFISGGAACDTKQNPAVRKRCSPWLPTLTKSTIPIWLSEKTGELGHYYTDRELSFSQGWPSISTAHNMNYKDSGLEPTFRPTSGAPILRSTNETGPCEGRTALECNPKTGLAATARQTDLETIMRMQI